MKFKTLLIIFTSNNEEGLTKCFNSIWQQEDKPDQVLIVDNSKDEYSFYNKGSIKKNNHIHLIRNLNHPSISFNTSRQMALRYVSENEFDLIILCEDDAYYDIGFVSNIKKSFARGNHLMMYKIKPNPEFIYDYKTDFVKDLGHFNLDFCLADYGDKSKVIDPKYIFNSFAFSKQIFKNSKGWRPDYYNSDLFLYTRYGESEFALDMSQYTEKIEYVANAIMYHDKREKRLNNKFFTWKYAMYGVDSGWKFIEENSLDNIIYINLKLLVLSLLIKSTRILLRRNAWRVWIYRQLIRSYHKYLLFYYYKSSQDLIDFDLTFDDVDWNEFDFKNLRPIDYKSWKLLIHS